MKQLTNVRIRYGKDGISTRVYSTPKGDIKVKLDIINMEFSFIDAMYNMTIFKAGGTKNLTVLKRKAKAKLCELMGVQFEPEIRPSRRGKRSNKDINGQSGPGPS